jgi:hypothetical protein
VLNMPILSPAIFATVRRDLVGLVHIDTHVEGVVEAVLRRNPLRVLVFA